METIVSNENVNVVVPPTAVYGKKDLERLRNDIAELVGQIVDSRKRSRKLSGVERRNENEYARKLRLKVRLRHLVRALLRGKDLRTVERQYRNHGYLTGLVTTTMIEYAPHNEWTFERVHKAMTKDYTYVPEKDMWVSNPIQKD